jgi:lysophospholipase L1-like esterase
MDYRVCFFGDSFTAGVGDDDALGWVGRVLAQARQDGRNVTGYNLGVRRETGPQIAARVLGEASARLLDGDAYGLVYAAGVNDTSIENGQPRAESSASVEALAHVLRCCDQQGWNPLVIGPTPVADEARNVRIAGLSEMLGARASERGVPFVDLVSPLTSNPLWMREVGSFDGAHPRRAGYERLASLIQPAFDELLAGVPARR